MKKQPEKIKIKQPPLLFDKTQKIIAKAEKILGCKTISYWTSDRGSVCANDVVALYELFQKIGPGDRASLFIKSGGGNPEAALRIVNLIREYYRHVTAVIPLECASAATMIALGADHLQMGPLAHLTAIDSSLIHDLSPLDERENRRVSVSQDQVSRIVNLWNKNAKDHHANPFSDIFKYIHPLVIGEIDRSSSLSIKIAKEILLYHLTDESEAERISRHLNFDYPSHSYPITSKEASKIGLSVSALDSQANELLIELNELYSEMAQKAFTDFDEYNYHDNEILNILEADGIQIYYQNDKDWNYLKEERRWQPMNDESSWRKIESVKGKTVHTQFHIR
ncbi:MAG TPA: hypothetical protein PKM65_14270 [Spirochaetota bacterium]|nr:hypothetical protein [Spirochaetota bacterium]HNT12904.1 hypothetical protein [Spirochaetota bacterium]HNV48292.1 hypothetical protein [Spirochaetota bacterium]HOS39304.1 hypothetical protein [Spirochaetota bacterium]HPI23122.1 hypothetical protein [Spirochaetota bacterium]